MTMARCRRCRRWKIEITTDRAKINARMDGRQAVLPAAGRVKIVRKAVRRVLLRESRQRRRPDEENP